MQLLFVGNISVTFNKEPTHLEWRRMYHLTTSFSGLASESVSDFQEELKQYWFQQYSRGDSVLDSSGFEHAFLGEVTEDGNDATGFHSWVKAYLEERQENLEYIEHQSTCEVQ